mmetsp:Transcript_34582/g.38847  ORF Transcript_34582/g.38847 Transcript_34582/m.38847 type:complete len:97 (+) Transcript_34582:344-634(+)
MIALLLFQIRIEIQQLQQHQYKPLVMNRHHEHTGVAHHEGTGVTIQQRTGMADDLTNSKISGVDNNSNNQDDIGITGVIKENNTTRKNQINRMMIM